MDFEIGVDTIKISGWTEVKNFADLFDNHATNHPTDDGVDLWIHAGKDRLIIKDFSKEDLDAADFVF